MRGDVTTSPLVRPRKLFLLSHHKKTKNSKSHNIARAQESRTIRARGRAVIGRPVRGEPRGQGSSHPCLEDAEACSRTATLSLHHMRAWPWRHALAGLVQAQHVDVGVVGDAERCCRCRSPRPRHKGTPPLTRDTRAWCCAFGLHNEMRSAPKHALSMARARTRRRRPAQRAIACSSRRRASRPRLPSARRSAARAKNRCRPSASHRDARLLMTCNLA